MRVNMDSSILSDPRFKRLANSLGIPLPHAVGSCMMVWTACYERLSPVMTAAEVDSIADIQGFAASMLHVGLSTLDGNGIRLLGILCDGHQFMDAKATRGPVIGGKNKSPKRPDLATAKWKALRKQVLSEDGTICAYCGRDCADAPTIDHKKPVSSGSDPFDRTNLAVSCRPCNSSKGNGIAPRRFN